MGILAQSEILTGFVCGFSKNTGYVTEPHVCDDCPAPVYLGSLGATVGPFSMFSPRGKPLMFTPPCVKVSVAQSCPTVCDPMDCSPPGSSVHGLLQARILEWAALSSSRGSSQPRYRTWVSWHCRQILSHLSDQGSPDTGGNCR